MIQLNTHILRNLFITYLRSADFRTRSKSFIHFGAWSLGCNCMLISSNLENIAATDLSFTLFPYNENDWLFLDLFELYLGDKLFCKFIVLWTFSAVKIWEGFWDKLLNDAYEQNILDMGHQITLSFVNLLFKWFIALNLGFNIGGFNGDFKLFMSEEILWEFGTSCFIILYGFDSSQIILDNIKLTLLNSLLWYRKRLSSLVPRILM